MRTFRLLLVLGVIFACATAASRVSRPEEHPANNEIEDDDDDDDDHDDDVNGNRLEAPVGTAHDDDSDGDGDSDGDSREHLQFASIKSRAIAMDRALCKKLSRYHPHYPRCQDYCERLNHWMGMCRRESCHCYS